MKDMKSFYKGTIFIFAVIFCSCIIGRGIDTLKSFSFDGFYQDEVVTDSEYGSFLAAQHAIYINDFESANKMLQNVNQDMDVVKQSKVVAAFLSGQMPDDVEFLKDSKDLSSRLIYDAKLLAKDDWAAVYKRYSKNDSLFLSPLRIFSSVHQGKSKDAIKYLNTLKTNDSWKAFVRGQIAVLNNDIDTAAKEFADVHPDFMNINDYLYLMSFYKKHEMFEDMDILRNDFMAKPGGAIVLDYKDIPDWSYYDGYKNNLAFSMIQNISHTQIMLFTDFSLMLLKFASLVSGDANKDAVNYYLGQYYFFNAGDYVASFNSISPQSPLYLFGQMKIAEKNGDIKNIEKIAKKNPLFVPAVKIVIANAIQKGDRRAALRAVNRVLRKKDISNDVRVVFLKHRANIYLLFNQPDKAQQDLDEIQDLDGRLLSDYVLLQARAWAAQDRELNRAYDYAMTLIKRNTSDVVAWDILGVIVDKREGVIAALDVLERIGEIGSKTSSLYEHLGDLYVKQGDKEKAIKSYMRALDLSDDGLVVAPFIEKKLRKLK